MKRIGGHLCIVLAAAAGRVEVVEKPIKAWMEEDLGNLWVLPKLRPKKESRPRRTKIYPVIYTASMPGKQVSNVFLVASSFFLLYFSYLLLHWNYFFDSLSQFPKGKIKNNIG